jgi:predicted dehydrogenase
VAVGVVRFASGALGVLHATTAAYPGLSARLQVHGDRGSVVIENDEFTFVNFTPAGTDPQEKAYGSSAKEINQADDYRSEGNGSATAGRDPGQLSDAHRLQYQNFLGALRGEEEIRVGLARTASRSA